jgi:hypothetical protein
MKQYWQNDFARQGIDQYFPAHCPSNPLRRSSCEPPLSTVGVHKLLDALSHASAKFLQSVVKTRRSK